MVCNYSVTLLCAAHAQIVWLTVVGWKSCLFRLGVSNFRLIFVLLFWNDSLISAVYGMNAGYCIIIIRASLSISKRAEHSSYGTFTWTVCLSVGPQSVLWQNSWLDPDAIWGGEWGWSRDGCITWGGYRQRGRGSFGGEVWASHCNQWGLCCVVVWKCIDQSSCRLGRWVRSARHWCIRWGSTCCAWQSFCTTSVQVLFGLPLGLELSTSYSIHFFTQSFSSFCSTCPYQRHLLCCSTEIMSSILSFFLNFLLLP